MTITVRELMDRLAHLDPDTELFVGANYGAEGYISVDSPIPGDVYNEEDEEQDFYRPAPIDVSGTLARAIKPFDTQALLDAIQNQIQRYRETDASGRPITPTPNRIVGIDPAQGGAGGVVIHYFQPPTVDPEIAARAVMDRCPPHRFAWLTAGGAACTKCGERM